MGYFIAEDIARVCHEANRGLTALTRDVPVQPPWDEAPAEQRESCVRGVVFALQNPSAPPSAMHDAWMKDKLEQGWKLGPVKDEAKKEHPALVPYDQLLQSVRLKDKLFKAVVEALR